jgi:hypothetical protein
MPLPKNNCLPPRPADISDLPEQIRGYGMRPADSR